MGHYGILVREPLLSTVHKRSSKASERTLAMMFCDGIAETIDD